MNEKINLTKILKDCPKGTKLYSTIFGEVEFIECDLLYQIVVAKEDKYYYFTSQGAFIFERIKYNLGECVLFPSEDQKDWSKFTAPWYKNKKERFDPKTLKPLDRVLVKDGKKTMSKRDLFVIIYCSVWGSLGVILTTLVHFNHLMEDSTFLLLWNLLFLTVTSSFVFIKPIGRFVDKLIEKLP